MTQQQPQIDSIYDFTQKGLNELIAELEKWFRRRRGSVTVATKPPWSVASFPFDQNQNYYAGRAVTPSPGAGYDASHKLDLSGEHNFSILYDVLWVSDTGNVADFEFHRLRLTSTGTGCLFYGFNEVVNYGASGQYYGREFHNVFGASGQVWMDTGDWDIGDSGRFNGRFYNTIALGDSAIGFLDHVVMSASSGDLTGYQIELDNFGGSGQTMGGWFFVSGAGGDSIGLKLSVDGTGNIAPLWITTPKTTRPTAPSGEAILYFFDDGAGNYSLCMNVGGTDTVVAVG